MENTKKFLRRLYPHPPEGAHLSLWERQGKASAHVPMVPGWEDVAARLAATWDAEGRDVYFGVGLRRGDLGRWKRGARKDVGWVPGLFVDIDFGTSGHASKALPPDLDSAISLLGAAPFAPTIVVGSGYGLHAYYLYSEGVQSLDALGGVAQYERTLDALQSRIRDAAAQQGWHVDNTAEAARVLRVPGTRNFKATSHTRTK